MIYVDDNTKELIRRYPDSTENDCKQVSLDIIGIFFNWNSFMSLNLDEEITKLNWQLVHRLLSTLKQ